MAKSLSLGWLIPMPRLSQVLYWHTHPQGMTTPQWVKCVAEVIKLHLNIKKSYKSKLRMGRSQANLQSNFWGQLTGWTCLLPPRDACWARSIFHVHRMIFSSCFVRTGACHRVALDYMLLWICFFSQIPRYPAILDPWPVTVSLIKSVIL